MFHPNVEFIWNFWPFTWIVWTPFRELFNVIMYITFPVTLGFVGLENVWNFIPETTFNLLNLTCGLVLYYLMWGIIIKEEGEAKGKEIINAILWT